MPTRLIDLPFTSGLNEAVDETVAQLPTMTELVNYRLTRSGRLEHRLGVQDVSIDTPVIADTAAAPDGSPAQAIHERSLVAGGHLYVSTESATAFPRWSCSGSVSRFVPWDSWTAHTDSAKVFVRPSCASTNGKFAVIASRESGGVVPSPYYIRIYDEATGVLEFSQRLSISITSTARILACGNSFVIVIMNLLTGSIYGTTMSVATAPYPYFPVLTLLATGDTAGEFDAAGVDTSEYIISYYDTGAGSVVIARYSSVTHALIGSRSLIQGLSVSTCYSYLYGGSRYYWLAWNDTTGPAVRAAVFNSSLTQIGATQTLALVTGTYRPVIGQDGTGGALVGFTGATTVPFTTFQSISNAAVLGTAYGGYSGYILGSKPFLADSPFVAGITQPACWLVNVNLVDADTDRSHILVTIGAGTDEGAAVEMSATPSTGPLVADQMLQVSEVVQSTAEGQVYWQTALLSAVRGLGTSAPQYTVKAHRFGDAAMSMRSRTRQVIPCQGSFAVLGGWPRYFDGAWANEIGIPSGASVISATPGGAGSMTPGATYRYVFVLEYYDGRGQRCLSYASNPYSVTLGGGDSSVSFEVLVPQLWASGNSSAAVDGRSVTLRAYRTAANVGTVYRFVPMSGLSNGSPAGPYEDQVSMIDTTADADIGANEAVYVQVGNAVSNYRAPACRFGTEHEGRLVVGGGWNPSEAIVSKLFFPGEGVQFTERDEFKITSPETITGFASLDGSLVMFAQRGIYTLTGDGPLDDGSGSFSSPRKLPGRVGCTDWRSIVTREEGVYFRSAEGIYLLPRGLASPQFVGAAVRESLRRFPETLGAATCTRSMLSTVADRDSETVIAWLVGDAEDPTEVAIFVYALGTGAWTRLELPEATGNPQVVIGVWYDMVNGSDVLGFARRDLDSAVTGSVLAENTGTGYSRDISILYTPILHGSWKTGKIFPFGFGGRGSVRTIRLVGECLSETTLTPTVYSDANPAGYTGDALTFTAGRFQVEVPFRRHDLAWVQIRMVDPTTGSENIGAGLRFNGLALEVEMEGGIHRTNPGERSA